MVREGVSKKGTYCGDSDVRCSSDLLGVGYKDRTGGGEAGRRRDDEQDKSLGLHCLRDPLELSWRREIL